ncbi:enoyl-CoA hydratase/isomerase family protein [Catenuloplanes sp. NPDC051500]|uniref:enoyl-CoA hydratase/isomerase family protein n=1 Tax=Catenuloplanes sp. NPDC051500 TaxID=3363959 RepID=UPI003787A19C
MTQFGIQQVTPAIRRVTFTNGPVNVVGADTLAELSGVVEALSGDERVRVVIFDSGTPGYFYNHADLDQLGALLTLADSDSTPMFVALATRLAAAPFVSIASIRGRTRGGGAELALAFDLRYASREEAFFCQPEVATGLVPGGGGGDRLPRLVGRDRALEVLLTSEDYDADRAERYGWVTRTVPDADLDAFVDAVAARIALFDRSSVLGVKAQINRATLPPAADVRASWTEFTGSVSWPGFQGRGAVFAALFAEVGPDAVERDLGHYLGVANSPEVSSRSRSSLSEPGSAA